MIVLDASVVIEVLLRAQAEPAVVARVFGSGDTLHAPHLLDVEVAQVIRRFAAEGKVGAERGRTALTDLVDLRLRRYPHDLLLPRIWALRSKLTAYDAAYVALAEALGVPLLTRDRRLAAAAGHDAEVQLV